MKGFGYGPVVALLKEQTNFLSTSRQNSMRMLFSSTVYGSLVLPVATCSAKISPRPPQEDLLQAFLRTKDSHASHPVRSDDITEKAHGWILKKHLSDRGEEFLREVKDGSQLLGDLSCLLVDEPTTATAGNGRAKQSLSQSLKFPSGSCLTTVADIAHGHGRRGD